MATSASHTTQQVFIGPVRLVLKSMRLAWLILVSIVLIPIAPLLGKQRAPALVRWWYGCVLRLFNVDVRIHGEIPDTPALIATNHSSWLDILVLGHVFDSVFISKAEVARWPIIGIYARAVGTLFLARGAHKTNETRARIRTTFAHGHSVVLFAEGTTSRTPQPQRFHARLFAAAIDGAHPVLPVAVRYSDANTPPAEHHPLVPWVNAPLLPNFCDVFRLPRLQADVVICPLIDSDGHNRRSIANASREAICRHLPAADNEPTSV